VSDYEKSKFDEGYDRGFNAGAESTKSTGVADELRTRYAYLKSGGSWAAGGDTTSPNYLAGFEDAMKTLGVKP
jgi:hypothetical protein